MFQCIVVDMLISIGAFLEGATDEAAYATYLENLEEKLRRRTSHMDAEESPRQEAAAGDSEEVPFPDTKLAKKFLQQRAKAKKENDKNSQYEEAYVQIMVWLFEHSKSLVNSADCPHAMDTQLVIQTLEASPPQNNIQPDLFGYASWKELVEEEWDPDHKGYVARPDINRFWGKFNVRHAFMKNRKPLAIETLGSFGDQMINSMYNVGEEGLLRDPSNAKRICSLRTKYVGLLDLKLEQGDKDFLYALGKRDTIAWLRQKAGIE